MASESSGITPHRSNMTRRGRSMMSPKANIETSRNDNTMTSQNNNLMTSQMDNTITPQLMATLTLQDNTVTSDPGSPFLDPFDPDEENKNNNNLNNAIPDGLRTIPAQLHDMPDTINADAEQSAFSNHPVVSPEPTGDETVVVCLDNVSPQQNGHTANIALDNNSNQTLNSVDLNSQQNGCSVNLCLDNMHLNSNEETLTDTPQNLQLVLASQDLTPHRQISSQNTNSAMQPRHRTGHELATIKTGDVEKERMLQERVKELGLWNNKRLLEQQVYEQLSRNIDQDGLFQAINKSKRKRPLRDRIESTKNEVINTVQPKLVKDEYGNNVAYKVNIIMGMFTHNIRHKIAGNSVTIQGSTPDNRASKLYKDVTIEFPLNVDISLIDVSFNAGVFKCEAPFFKMAALTSRMTSRRTSKSLDSTSSYQSCEETESVASSDLKSVDGLP